MFDEVSSGINLMCGFGSSFSLQGGQRGTLISYASSSWRHGGCCSGRDFTGLIQWPSYVDPISFEPRGHSNSHFSEVLVFFLCRSGSRMSFPCHSLVVVSSFTRLDFQIRDCHHSIGAAFGSTFDIRSRKNLISAGEWSRLNHSPRRLA